METTLTMSKAMDRNGWRLMIELVKTLHGL